MVRNAAYVRAHACVNRLWVKMYPLLLDGPGRRNRDSTMGIEGGSVHFLAGAGPAPALHYHSVWESEQDRGACVIQCMCKTWLHAPQKDFAIAFPRHTFKFRLVEQRRPPCQPRSPLQLDILTLNNSTTHLYHVVQPSLHAM